MLFMLRSRKICSFYDKYIKKGMCDREAQYASLIEGMDKSLGDMMDLFEEKGIAESTIIIFMSDNGGIFFIIP